MALHDDLKVAPIALWLGGKFSNLPRASRMALLVVCAAFSLICMYGTREITEVPKEIIAQHVFPDQGGRLSRFLKGSTPSVNLVVAATSTEDYSWTKEVKLPGMVVVPMIFSLNHLDVREVQRRQFLNLRVTWGVGCSTNTINTTRVNEEDGSTPEQKEMQEAFRANFNVYEEYDEWIELNQGRQRLEEELRKINGEGGQETEEEKAEEKNKLSETEQRLKQKSREWLESELQIVSEAIRVRREVAIVRGAVERNRLAEGEPLRDPTRQLGRRVT
ncbi:hypothetical protein BUE80_DR003817 [Diplocarpon rosae]|nr:hypothetical protein BUE80_DR003817 [Diplocarpon rosae]